MVGIAARAAQLGALLPVCLRMTGSMRAPPYLAGTGSSLCCLGRECDLDHVECPMCEHRAEAFFFLSHSSGLCVCVAHWDMCPRSERLES